MAPKKRSERHEQTKEQKGTEVHSLEDTLWVRRAYDAFKQQTSPEEDGSLEYEAEDLVYRSDSLVSQGQVIMGYLAVPVEVNSISMQQLVEDSDVDLAASVGPGKQKQFYAVDFETRLFGMLTGQNLQEAEAVAFTSLKSA